MAKASLFVILAREARIGVIFRRGPSKQVLLIKWNLADDSFEMGQWFKGRIYERRCDLSPSGQLLAYFAAKFREPTYAWTAISRPPFLTALAFWPKCHGAWGGGGLFESEGMLVLNHRPDEFDLGPDSPPNNRIRIKPLGEHAGQGEDNPIYHLRLVRDGWTLKQSGVSGQYRRKGPMSWQFEAPQIYEKPMRQKGVSRQLQMHLSGVGERQGDWYVLDYMLTNEQGHELLKLPRIDWADWDRNGDLLYTANGKLFRLPWRHQSAAEAASAVKLADFSGLTFEPIAAPETALRWPKRKLH